METMQELANSGVNFKKGFNFLMFDSYYISNLGFEKTVGYNEGVSEVEAKINSNGYIDVY